MFARAAKGFLKGLLIGAAVFALLAFGLGMGTSVVGAYLGAAVVGCLTATVAGRPLWAAEAKVEVGLKAVVGTIVATVAVFVVRKWLPVQLDLSLLGQGSGPLGEQPFLMWPLIGAGLGVLFELDDAAGAEAAGRTRVGSRTRIESSGLDSSAVQENEISAKRGSQQR